MMQQDFLEFADISTTSLQNPSVMEMPDSEIVLLCIPLDRCPNSAPAPIVTTHFALWREQCAVVNQILIDILFFMTCIHINEIRPQIRSHEPQGGG